MTTPATVLAPVIDAETYLDNVAPCDHVVHLYERDDVFLDTLEGFVRGGFRGGETVVVIATPAHVYSLEHRLRMAGCNLHEMRASGDYVALDAAETLARFTVDGVPDESRFIGVIDSVLDEVQASGKRARAFGEMVALMWAEGNRAGARRLEQMWNSVCHERGLSLLCAYPRTKADSLASFDEVCSLHSHVIAA